MPGVEAILAVLGGAVGGAAATGATMRMAREAAAEFAQARGWIKRFRQSRG
jgi:hypothetical protein